jgi:murein DD-endopeptidase MepM/ murein hydrolase activator NlpD
LHSVTVHSAAVVHKTAASHWLPHGTRIELVGVRVALILAVGLLALLGDATAQAEYERLHWPLRPSPPVVRGFDAPSPNWNAGHRGVDLVGAPGQPVYAAGSATVVFAAMLAGRPVVSLAHHGGLRTSYEPVVAAVHVGQLVTTESVIGKLAAGHPGCGAAACLHWGAMWGPAARADYVDPLGLLASTPIRLKPLRG